MGFLRNEEQRQLVHSAEVFLAAQSPVSLQRRIRDSGVAQAMDPALWQQVIDLGWPAAVFSEDDGGLGVGYRGMGGVFQACGRHLAALPLLSSAVLCGSLLSNAGDAVQKARWLAPLIEGRLALALAMDESGRHDPHRIATRARLEGGQWHLQGEKWFVIDGLGADAFVVTARLDGGAGADAGAGNIGLFVMAADTPGLQVQPLHMADSRNYARMQLAGVLLPADALLAACPDSAQALDAALDLGRICLAAEAMGLIRYAFDTTLAYLKERVQFGVPIGSFQALQHRMARLYTEIEMLQSCVLAALDAIDQGDPELPLLASLAKARASDLCEKAMNEAVQMHGGIGVTDALDLGLYVKRARLVQQCLGDGVFHRARYARLRGI